MPVYEYKCSCGNQYEARHGVDFRDAEVCPDCGFKPERVFSFTTKPVVYEYFSENLNAQVTGPKQKERLMKERNVSPVGGCREV